MAEQTDLVDLQSPVYDPCGQTKRGEEMTASELIRALRKVPKDARVTSDSGWECFETDVVEVWYSSALNEVRFTQRGYYTEDEGFEMIEREK